MNRILFILAFLALVSCTNEEKEAVDSTDDTEKKDDIPIVNGFGCEVNFNEEGYAIRVSKDNNLLFEVSEDIGKGSKQYLESESGSLTKVNISNILVRNILQYENTYYLLLDLKDYDITSYWGIRKLYVAENGKVNKITFNSDIFLPTVMNLWFENSIILFVPYSLYPEVTHYESRVYDNSLRLINKHCPRYAKPLDMTHCVNLEDNKIISFYDISDTSSPLRPLWSYIIELENKNFTINSWDASYSSNNTVLVTVNITYITGEKEVLNLEFDKETGELIK